MGYYASSLRSKRSCSTEELRNDFPETGRSKVGKETEGKLARPPISEKRPHFNR